VPRARALPVHLKETLDDLCRVYDRRFLETDPVGIVRRYDDPGDREVVGLLAAGLAYGRVASIRQSLERLLAALGTAPARFVASFDPRRDARRLEGFRHRFTSGRDISLLFHLLRQAREGGGLEAMFLAADSDPSCATIEAALEGFGQALFAQHGGPFVRDGFVPRRDGARWLLPLPSGGSACKRSCLFLRWMVRPDDGVDCGVWTRVSPARLVLPLDTHLQRVVRSLGWTRRRTPSWRMALEATARLRDLDPADPVRFDFALSRLGILGHLRARGGRLSAREVRAALAGGAS
jgi:uncharacterized protein (TIGR02757 family)